MRIRCNEVTLIVLQTYLYSPALLSILVTVAMGDYSRSVLPSDHNKNKSWHASQRSSFLKVYWKF
jgi:hypothetical protein